ERGGHLHLFHMAELNGQTMYDLLNRNIDKTVDVIMTDESKLYGFKMTRFEKKHKAVNHSAEEYVRYENGQVVTTNTVESAFSLLRRGIIGTWHRVSVK